MFCRNCGKELGSEDKFCLYCGAPIGDAPAPESPAPTPVQQPVQQPVYHQPVQQQPVQQQPIQQQPVQQPAGGSAPANEKGQPKQINISIPNIDVKEKLNALKNKIPSDGAGRPGTVGVKLDTIGILSIATALFTLLSFICFNAKAFKISVSFFITQSEYYKMFDDVTALKVITEILFIVAIAVSLLPLFNDSFRKKAIVAPTMAVELWSLLWYIIYPIGAKHEIREQGFGSAATVSAQAGAVFFWIFALIVIALDVLFILNLKKAPAAAAPAAAPVGYQPQPIPGAYPSAPSADPLAEIRNVVNDMSGQQQPSSGAPIGPAPQQPENMSPDPYGNYGGPNQP